MPYLTAQTAPSRRAMATTTAAGIHHNPPRWRRDLYPWAEDSAGQSGPDPDVDNWPVRTPTNIDGLPTGTQAASNRHPEHLPECR